MKDAIFIHNVYFWLIDTASQEDRLQFESGLAELGQSSCTSAYFWGKPLELEKRDVVDDSYDYAATSFFDNLEQHDIYQSTDAVHSHFINSFKHLWKSVKVFDHRILNK